jgi:hypothetical protein
MIAVKLVDAEVLDLHVLSCASFKGVCFSVQF